MMYRHAVWLCVVPLVSGCGALGWRDQPATLADLQGRHIEIVPAPMPDDTRDRAMANYRAYLGTDGDDALRPEAMRRLADLQLEENERRQAELPNGTAAEPVAPDPAESVALYETVLREYPQYAHRDKALYQLARAHDDAGHSEVVLATLERLVREHPDTPLRSEAEFRRGEILFVHGRYGAAEVAYQAVLERGDDSDFYERALYKLGWARFKQSFYATAMDAFIALLDRRLATGTAAVAGMGRAERELLDDTLRVVSLSVSYQEGAASLDAYFQRRGERAYEDLIYANLGELYLNQERYSDAAAVFHAYVERHPLARPAPVFQARVIAAYERGGFPTLVLSSKRDFVERYALTGPYWQVHVQAEVPEVVAALKRNLQDLARHYHAVAQQSRQAPDYAEAARWYRAFIASFPHGDATPRMNFLLAETLFESQAYAEAAAEYARTAYDYPRHPQSAEAGYAALLAYDRHGATLPAGQQAAWQRRAIASALQFAATYTEHPQAVAVQTRAAGDLFKLGDFAAAAQAAQQVVERADGPRELRRTAWTVVAHASFDLGDYERAEAAYQQTLALVPAQESGRQALVERLAAAVYRQGEQARTRGDLAAAAAHFARVRSNAPGAEIVATADYDAAAALLELRDWPNATAQLEAFRRHHPDHTLQPEVTRKLAVAYLEGGRIGQAAAEFVRVADASQDPHLQREALWQAAELYQQSHQTVPALQTWGDYVKRFPQPLEPATEARQQLADLHTAAGAPAARLAVLTELVQHEAAAPSTERSERTRYLAARAALEIAMPAVESYRRIVLKAPLKKHLDSKQRHLKLAVAACTRAAEYGVAEVTTAATYHIAEIYRHFGQALLDSERPGNLSAEEAEQYVLLLEEQAFPFEEQAIEIHETNVARIPQGIYDDWVRQSLQQLAQLLPVRYAKQERGEDDVAEIR